MSVEERWRGRPKLALADSDGTPFGEDGENPFGEFALAGGQFAFGVLGVDPPRTAAARLSVSPGATP